MYLTDDYVLWREEDEQGNSVHISEEDKENVENTQNITGK
jgi:hypothetical protein